MRYTRMYVIKQRELLTSFTYIVATTTPVVTAGVRIVS